MQTNPSISVSCVIYETPLDVLQKTIDSLSKAIEFAQAQHSLGECSIYLINNKNETTDSFTNICQFTQVRFKNTIIKSGHGNIGYGLGNNEAIDEVATDVHLILNPDVIIDVQAIHIGVEYLATHPIVGLVAPHATNGKGEIEYLAKRPPSTLIILLRGLNLKFLNRLFSKTLDEYAYRDLIPATTPIEIELASGCFMLCKTEILKQVKGFSAEFFLYFEDFDLCNKIRQHAKIHFLPQMQIVHLGGNTARKSWAHIKYFFASYFIYAKKYHTRHL